MITAWPLDNKEYTAEAIGAYNGVRTRGVFSAESCLKVTASGGRTLTVSPGSAWLKRGPYWGLSFLSPQQLSFTVDVASGTLSRYVAVVVQVDFVTNAENILLRYGALATNPVMPEPVRDEYCDEIIIAQYLQRAGSTEVLAADLTDTRMQEKYCGLVRDGVERIPTEALTTQARALIAQLQEELAAANAGALYAMVIDDTAPLPASGWSEAAPYTQTVAASKMAQRYEPMADVVLSGTAAQKAAQLEAWSCVSEMTTGSGTLTAVCLEDRPAVDITVKLKAVI